MNPRNLDLMDRCELERYARAVGADAPRGASKAQLREAIDQARERTATVTLLGEPYEVRFSALRDKRLIDLVSKGGAMGASDCGSALALLLGEEQTERLSRACTDEDGAVDVDSVMLAYAQMDSSAALKNLLGSRR